MSKDKTKEDIREYTMKLDMKELVNIGFEAYRCALLSQYVHLYSSTRLQIRFQLLLPTSCGISETGRWARIFTDFGPKVEVLTQLVNASLGTKKTT